MRSLKIKSYLPLKCIAKVHHMNEQQRQASAYPHGRLHTVYICIHEWIHGSTFSTLCSKSLFHTEIFQLFLEIYHPSCHLLTSQSK